MALPSFVNTPSSTSACRWMLKIQDAAEAQDDRHGAAPAIGHAVTPCAPAQKSEDRAQRHTGRSPTQLVIPPEQVPQPMQQTQQPPSDRHV